MNQLSSNHATGYSHFASYLINGDASSLTKSEIAIADAFADYCGRSIIDCSTESFFASPDNGGLKGDCVEYFLMPTNSEDTNA